MIPEFSRSDVLSALRQIAEDGEPSNRAARGYELVHKGRSYSPKYVVALAVKAATGRALSPGQHSGGRETNERLARLGFDVRPIAERATPPSGKRARKSDATTAESAVEGTYYARLCWNSQGWTRPTGEASSTETGSYVSTYGFGHEEWLFNYQWEMEGWQYGFLQPINKSLARLQGKSVDLRLYTCAPTKERFRVADISRCEVLTEDMARNALEVFDRSGWTRDMERDVRAIGGSVKGFKYKKATERLNIRFRIENANVFPAMQLVDSESVVDRVDRYDLVATSKGELVGVEVRSRSGTTRRNVAGRQLRAAVPAHHAELQHNPLQQELFEVLRARFGRRVIMEEDFVDIKLRLPDGLVLVEVKVAPSALRALRESLGQLLAYSFACAQKKERVARMVVAAPCRLDAEAGAFLAHLEKRLGLGVDYLCVRRGRVRGAVDDWFDAWSGRTSLRKRAR